MKRRSAIMALGTLAVGSGATFSGAAFSGSIGSSGNGMSVVSASNVIVGPGGTEYNDDMEDLTPSDLPAASVTAGDGSINIDIVTGINASGESFSGLFSIENQGTDAIEVDIDFTDVNDLNGDISKAEIQGAYSFKMGGADISDSIDDQGDSVEGTPAKIGIGETKDVKLEIDFKDPTQLVSTLRDDVDRPSGSPFGGGEVGDTTGLVNEITINTNPVN